jgi:sugar phosphate isomerase/epimerase
MNKIDDGWVFAQIGQGVVNYDIILRELVEDKKLIPLSIEHLFIYNATKNLIVQRKAKTPELDQIRRSLKASYDYVKSFIHK